jgi:uncharacterized RDD family membrane protein YckC
MEQNDDFEMKPLTPGLGFHKRQVSLKEHLAKSGASQQSLRRSLPTEPPPDDSASAVGGRSSRQIIEELHEVLKPGQKTDRKATAAAQVMTEILPRDISEVRQPRQAPEISPLKKIDFQIPDKNISDSVRRGASDNLVKPLTAISVSFSAMFLDGAIVLAFSLIFLMTLVMVTGVDLVSVAQSSQADFATQLSLIALYLAVFEMYAIVSRSFFGRTVGEWTFDLQMGTDEQITKSFYPAQVLWRSILTLVTGLIVLPLLSLAFGKDLAAKLSGLQLYRRNY